MTHEEPSVSETLTERYVANNHVYASGAHSLPPVSRSARAAIVACMDARLDLFAILGAKEGESHVIRNAGGVVSDDAMRSLLISQHLLGTREIILVHHTDCGMLTFSDDQLRERIASKTGSEPALDFLAFEDLAEDVRSGMRRIRESPFLLHREVRGFVYNLTTRLLEEVFIEDAPSA
jgi:carbonic anhydrase